MKNEPCLQCSLPDCDENSPSCALRRIANVVNWKRRHGRSEDITDAERAAYNAHFQIWKLADLAKRSEALS